MAAALVHGLRDLPHEPQAAPSVHQIHLPRHLCMQRRTIPESGSEPNRTQHHADAVMGRGAAGRVLPALITHQLLPELDGGVPVAAPLAGAAAAEHTKPPEPAAGVGRFPLAAVLCHRRPSFHPRPALMAC